MNIAQAKALSISGILSALDHPVAFTHKGGVEQAYRSPFREESHASFYVNIAKNVWYDQGSGEGGNIIDFALRMSRQLGMGESVSSALSWLSSYQDLSWYPPRAGESGGSSLVIEQIIPLQHPGLLRYLEEERGIPRSLGERYLEEVHFSQQGRGYFALGFRNQGGGYELRNAYYKGASAHDIRLIEGSRGSGRGDQVAVTVHVFEGFMDYLSLLTLRGREALSGDVLVLNGTSMVERGVERLKTGDYGPIYSWLDPGVGGERATARLQQELGDRVQPMQGVYGSAEDLNDYLLGLRRSGSLQECQHHFRKTLSNYLSQPQFGREKR